MYQKNDPFFDTFSAFFRFLYFNLTLDNSFAIPVLLFSRLDVFSVFPVSESKSRRFSPTAFYFQLIKAYSAGCCSTAGVSLAALSTCSAAASRKARISLSF